MTPANSTCSKKNYNMQLKALKSGPLIFDYFVKHDQFTLKQEDEWGKDRFMAESSMKGSQFDGCDTGHDDSVLLHQILPCVTLQLRKSFSGNFRG